MKSAVMAVACAAGAQAFVAPRSVHGVVRVFARSRRTARACSERDMFSLFVLI